MEAIAITLTIIFLLLLIASIAGLIKPSLVMQKTRKKAFFINLGAAFFVFILIGISAPHKNASKQTSKSEIKEQTDLIKKPSNQPIGIAKTYSIIEKSDYSFSGRKRIRWQIVAPEAISVEDRIATAIQAAKDLEQQTNADQATIWLEINKILSGKGLNLANVTFTPDGKGNSGQDNNSNRWEVKVADIKLEAGQIKIANEWYLNRSKFLNKDGLTDESKLKTYIANKLNILEKQVSLPWITQKEFRYNESI